MNRRTRKRGFTLIELLVVMAIIAILMALLLPMFQKARTQARLRKAKAEVKQLEMAFNSVLNDYRTWGAEGAQIPSYNGNVDTNMVVYLHGSNRRRIQFMEVNRKSLNPAGAFVDPWNQPYKFALDQTYRNNADTTVHGTVPRNVAVWSKGPDGQDDSEATVADDVKSWE